MYEEDGFIREIITFPDLICVVGSTYRLNEAKRLINEKNIVLSYDTTFSVGQCYISPLLFKHTDYIEEPVMAVLFLIHERKLTSNHSCLFRVMHEHCGNLQDIPCLIDMELGIRNAITQETKLKIVGCWRHLRKDIEAWVGKHGGAATDKNVYVDNVYDLLRSENEANYLDSLAEKKKIWSKAFVEYYDQHISKRILYIKTEFANCVPVWGFSKSRIRHEYLLFWFPKFIMLSLSS